jgi:ADP-ribosylglycohydrolase
MSDLISTPLYQKTLGCLLGGLIGDAMGTPTEGKQYQEIEARYGWLCDFSCDGTDDTVMKNLLAQALIRSQGFATMDDWAAVWLENWEAIFGAKVGKFFISVLHTAHKMRRHTTPRIAALGNMPSSSSAMGISPVGIVNACRPRQAARQAYNLAALIHTPDVGFCQDGAAAMAAAVAEAFKPRASVESILESATAYLEKLSGQEMLRLIAQSLALAKELGDYRAFRRVVYEQSERFFRPIMCDSRETVPLTLALFYLAGGKVEECITYSANFGRDADTIASMCGAIAGAWQGVGAFPSAWIEKARQFASADQEKQAEALARTALDKLAAEREEQALLLDIAR